MVTNRILIVDDEETLCEVLKLNLENEGYDVDIAFSAEQALTYDLRGYSLILLDIMMGEISGIKMAKMLKADVETADIPIIFCNVAKPKMTFETTLDEDDFVDYLCAGTLVGSLEGSGSIRRIPRRNVKTIMGTREQVTGKLRIYANAARTRAILRKSNVGLMANMNEAMWSTYFDNYDLFPKIGPEIHYLPYSDYGLEIENLTDQEVKEYADEGYKYAVCLDLSKYFDTLNHELLMNMLRQDIKDKKLIELIKRYLKSGVMINGLISPTREGTPQGGNLSPLLSNIYLTAFDKLLESRGHKFVRYADDCNIYVKSRRAAERVMNNCVKFLEGRLKLKVNREKSRVGSPLKLKFLGFSMYKTGKKSGIRPHNKSIKKFKDKIRELTSRKQARSIENILQRLKRYTTGWLGYYAMADMENKIKALNEWIRRRIRQIFWKQ